MSDVELGPDRAARQQPSPGLAEHEAEDRPFISVVIPVYQAAQILPALCERLESALSKICDNFEVVMVEDRSRDDSWTVLERMATEYSWLTAVRLSRNFGQAYATTAGLDMVRGEWTVVMDCDLQDQPEEISALLAKANEGYDIVAARRHERKDKASKKFGSWLFWKVFSVLSGHKTDNKIGSFRIMHNRVVTEFCTMREQARIFGGLIDWLGFERTTINVAHASREEGKSSYSLRKLIRMALDGILSFSNRPLYASVVVGGVIAFVAGSYGAFYLGRYLVFGVSTQSGWLSTVLLISFLGGLILLNQGILGLYLARVYDHAKARPLYVVDRIVVGHRANLPKRTSQQRDERNHER